MRIRRTPSDASTKSPAQGGALRVTESVDQQQAQQPAAAYAANAAPARATPTTILVQSFMMVSLLVSVQAADYTRSRAREGSVRHRFGYCGAQAHNCCAASSANQQLVIIASIVLRDDREAG
jgi:hypothetical protein